VSFAGPAIRLRDVLGKPEVGRSREESVMKRYLLLYRGPQTPPGATHEGWPEWFAGIGEALVDAGSPMQNGFVVQSDGSIGGEAAYRNGYSIIQARDPEHAAGLLKSHPFLSYGAEYTVEVFEVPRKQPAGGGAA
jgi:hypothetical protein